MILHFILNWWRSIHTVVIIAAPSVVVVVIILAILAILRRELCHVRLFISVWNHDLRRSVASGHVLERSVRARLERRACTATTVTGLLLRHLLLIEVTDFLVLEFLMIVELWSFLSIGCCFLKLFICSFVKSLLIYGSHWIVKELLLLLHFLIRGHHWNYFFDRLLDVNWIFNRLIFVLIWIEFLTAI